MRRLNLKPKNQVVVQLPDDLVLFLTEVTDLIDAGDDSTILQSDDLLQCECAYGGLTEEGGSEYSFCYFLEENVRVKWEFSLNRDEIGHVARRELAAISLWQCEDPSCRCAFADPTESCFYCDWEEIESNGN